MPDLDERLATLDRVSPPELWRRIERHQPRRPVPDRDRRGPSRLLAAVVAILVAVAGIAVAIRAFSSGSPKPLVSPSPAPERPGSLIAFETQSDSDPVPVIALMRSDGTGIHRLVAGMGPTWSPDGTKIAFSCGTLRAICVMDADGTHLRQITTPPTAGGDESPSWGPSSIAFTRSYSFQSGGRPRDIFTVNPDGTQLRRLTTDASDDFDPTWSPDGTQFAFSRIARVLRPPGQPREVQDIWQIWVMHADGSGEHALTAEATGATRPAWSPDGSLIAFDEDAVIFMMSPDGTGLHQLTPGTADAPGRLGAFPAWSPDSTRIVFTCGDGDTNNDICVMNADGTGRHNLTTGPENEGTPAWQPSEPIPVTPSPTPTPEASSLPPAGQVLGTVVLTSSPDQTVIWTVSDGTVYAAMWVSSEHSSQFTLVQVDPDGSRTTSVAPFDLIDYLFTIAVSPDGYVYVGTSVIKRFTEAKDELIRVDPDSGRVEAKATFDGRVAPLAHGASLWASIGDGRVVRLDRATLGEVASRRLVPLGRALSNSAVLSRPEYALGRVWVLVEDGLALDLVSLDPQSLDVLSRTPVPREGDLFQALSQVVGDDSHLYLVGGAIQPVGPNGGLLGAPVLVPGMSGATVFGDGLVGFVSQESTDTKLLVELSSDGTILAGLDVPEGGSDIHVEGPDAWFAGDMGQGSGIVHVRLGPAAPAAPPVPTPSGIAPSEEGLPSAVAETRDTILAAASTGDYEMLRDVLVPAVFLSDYGFGVDPIDRWDALGTKPLATMAVLLQMPFAIKGGSEGTVYRWPWFTSENAPSDLTAEERAILATVFSDQEIDQMFRTPDDGGYVGPELEILADGTWSSFRTPAEGGP
jgi:dipeptidyl aminopeptidase/acylaminoacyl peptidase